MTEYSAPWGGTTTGDAAVSAPYQDDFWSDMWSLLFTYRRTRQGVIRTSRTGYTSELAITNPSGNTIRVANGAAVVGGKVYQNTANVDNTITTPAAPDTNYYTFVLRKSFANQTVRVAVVGPSTVTYPALTQTDGTTWEIPLAYVNIVHTTGVITIVDAREYVNDEYVNDAATTTSSLAFSVIHSTSGAAADGFGAHIGFQLENDANQIIEAGAIGVSWQDASDASENGQVDFYAYYTTNMVLVGRITAPNTASAIGNARGVGAVDFQTHRTAVTQVASGSTSALLGGSENTASGAGGVVVGGSQNVASGIAAGVIGGDNNDALGAGDVVAGGAENVIAATVDYGFIGGGYFNTISGTSQNCAVIGGQANDISADADFIVILGGNQNEVTGAGSDYAAIIGGYNNTITNALEGIILGGGAHALNDGDYSAIITGASNTVSGNYAVSLGGRYLNIDKLNQIGFGYHGSVAGAVQGSLMTVSGQITHDDNTWRTLYLDGSAITVDIASNSVWTFDILIVGTTAGNAKSFGYAINGVIKNDASAGPPTTVLLASNVTTLYEDDVSFDAQVVADTVNDALAVQVRDTDGASDVVRWTAVIRTAETIYSA